MAQDYEDIEDDELEARQRAADGEDADHNPGEGDDTTAGAPATEGAAADDTVEGAGQQAGAEGADTTEGAAAEAAGAEDGKAAKVDGVASKDGSRVLPYGALQAARRDARRAESRAERAEREAAELKQQLADFKAGKTPAADGLTEEAVAELEETFPEHGKKVRELFEKTKAAAPAAPAPAPADEPGDDPVQEIIDQVPLLVEWQHSDPEKFARTAEHDAVLMKSPKWANKPAIERFTEAARRTAEEYDIPVPVPKTSAKTPPAAPAPAPKPAAPALAAQRRPPETLSDFKGGSVPDHGSLDATRATPQQLLARMQGMSNDEIDAHLARFG